MATTKDQDAPQTRRERRWSRNAQKDRERREVRTSNGASSGSKGGRSVVIQIGGAKPKKRRRRPRVSKKHGVLASIYLIVTSIATLAWLTVGGVLWGVASLLSGLVMVATVVLMFDPESVVPTQPRRRPSTASPRAPGKPGAGGSSSGTRTRKQSPVKPKRRVCSARCQVSTKDVSTCECVCQGRTHGSRKLKSVS